MSQTKKTNAPRASLSVNNDLFPPRFKTICCMETHHSTMEGPSFAKHSITCFLRLTLRTWHSATLKGRTKVTRLEMRTTHIYWLQSQHPLLAAPWCSCGQVTFLKGRWGMILPDNFLTFWPSFLWKVCLSLQFYKHKNGPWTPSGQSLQRAIFKEMMCRPTRNIEHRRQKDLEST